MLLFGRQRQRDCQQPSRRSFLEIGASSIMGLSMLDKLRASGSEVGRAKSVVLLWLWGGPPHIDTFDPKPMAPLEYRGPFSTIATRTPGMRITELFPKIAQLSDRFALIRSLHTQSNDHGVAGTIGLTGSAAGGTGLDGKPLPGAPRPAMGSTVARAKNATGALPPFLVIGGKLHQGKKAIIGEGGGSLGALYDPFRLEYDPENGTRVPALQLGSDLTPERLHDRQGLMTAFDSLQLHQEQKSKHLAMDAYRQRAFSMLTSPQARSMFDLTLENPKTIESYGKTRFGQSCLLARRLVEGHVPFIQVNWSDHVEAEEDAGDGGWDHHYRNFPLMQDRHGPGFDQAFSAFLTDLDDRGLLKSTLVIAMGEFGRAPKINDKAGRDHWEKCYCAIVAGAGVTGGKVIGSSDAKGELPNDTPLTPADIVATAQSLAGISSEQAATLGLSVGGRVIEEAF
jgi:hypothetical protein